MKKLLFYVMMLLPMIVNGAAVEINGIYYNLNSNSKTAEVNINPSVDYSGEVTIPQTVIYQGLSYEVKSIGMSAFSGCNGLTSITIPNSVTSIGFQAFCNCSCLTSITIPNSVTSIGYGAFQGCSGLTSITIPNSVTSIGSHAFYGCISLTSITIPNSVTYIGERTFDGCSSLTSITIPNSVTSIGFQAFCNCSCLTSITIPNSVTYIGGSAFSGCSGLTSITVETGNIEYDSRNNCNAIIEKSSNSLIVGCKNTTIPTSVTSIGYYAFEGSSGLTSITIPNSVVDIGIGAFDGCSGLTSITIPNSVTSIGDGAFSGCISLTSITIPNSVTSIGDDTFSGCISLTSITIPNSVVDIGVCAFDGCSGLTSITIPNSVRSIGSHAFYNNSALTDIFCYAESVPSSYEVFTDPQFGKVRFILPMGMGLPLLSDYSNVTLHVPSGSIEAYASTGRWNEFECIVPIEEDDLQEYLNSLNSFDDTQDVLLGSIYTRQFLNTEWQSLYVPFSLNYSDWSNNFEVARLGKFSQYDEDDDGEAERQELEAVIMRSGNDVLNANTPYLIRAKKAGTYNFTVNPSKLVAEHINSVTYSANGSKVVITGNYANQSGLKSAGRYRLMGGSLSLPSKDEEVLPPYRWYATIENSDKAKVRITFVDDATGIESINVDNEEIIGERKVYDLSGRRINISKDTPISSLPKGIYIINNKKYIVK